MDIPDDAPLFTLNGLKMSARVTDVYDGDTVKVIFKFKDIFYKWNCRLLGIDTPEIRTKNLKEKEFGLKTRDFLRSEILNKIVTVKCYEFDKYGRLLVNIYMNDVCINDKLIQHGYAKKYDGGTKTKWF